MSENMNQFEAQVQAFSVSFLASLEWQVREVIARPWPGVRLEIEGAAESLIDLNAFRVIDFPSQSHLILASFLLAAYRVLVPLLPERALLQRINEALNREARRRMASYLIERFGITPDTPQKAFEKAAANFKKLGEVRFGETFIYEQEVQTEKAAVTIVRKCFFNEFFRANDGLKVLPVVCAGDELWMEELSFPKYRLKTYRTALFSRGDDVCRFHFERLV